MEGPPRPDDDAELIARARGGDAGAYEALVRRHQAIAFRAACFIVGSAADAEDVVQEAFVKAYYALPRFRPGAPFRPWLLQIVSNEARNRRRAAGRRERLRLRAAPLTPGGADEPSPEAAALAAERREGLLAALADLRDEDRQVIAYRYFLELSEAEMATALGCARGTVKSRLSRALGRLRARFAGRDAGLGAEGSAAIRDREGASHD